MAMRMMPAASGVSRSRLRLALEKISSAISRTAWMIVFVNESIVPEVMAAAGGTPCRWKKRMFTAMRAKLEGSARFM